MNNNRAFITQFDVSNINDTLDQLSDIFGHYRRTENFVEFMIAQAIINSNSITLATPYRVTVVNGKVRKA